MRAFIQALFCSFTLKGRWSSNNMHISEVFMANSSYSKRSVPLCICYLKCGDFMIIAAHSVDAQRFISVVSLFFIMSQNFSKPQSHWVWEGLFIIIKSNFSNSKGIFFTNEALRLCPFHEYCCSLCKPATTIIYLLNNHRVAGFVVDICCFCQLKVSFLHW